MERVDRTPVQSPLPVTESGKASPAVRVSPGRLEKSALPVDRVRNKQSEIVERRRKYGMDKLNLIARLGVTPFYTLADLQEARAETGQQLSELKASYEEDREALFEELKVELLSLQREHNANPSGERPNLTALSRHEFSNSSLRVAESRVIAFEAATEQKLNLLEQKLKIDETIHASKWEFSKRFKRWNVERKFKSIKAKRITTEVEQELNGPIREQLKKVRKVWEIDTPRQVYRWWLKHQLKPAVNVDVVEPLLPKRTYLFKEWQKKSRRLYNQTDQTLIIEHDLIKKALAKDELFSPAEAKAVLKETKANLGWGSTATQTVLAKDHNWTTTNRFTTAFDKNGKMHTFIDKEVPLSRNPAGLRKKNPEEATNLHVTIHSELGRESHVMTSFRGGQFPTKEAAEKAVAEIQKHAPGKTIHSNGLLTPTAFPSPKDRELLRTHRENIEATEVDHILTNFGVNKGAVGTLNILGIPVQLGWHHATGEYNNAAAKKLSEKLKGELGKVDQENLGPVVHVAREMSELWETNAFANASIGNDPYKMAAHWMVLDHFMGIATYTHCMSGKDRTSEVVADAHALIDEIWMNSSASLPADPIESAQGALGFDSRVDLMQQKPLPWYHRFAPNTVGLPTAGSVKNSMTDSDAASFENVLPDRSDSKERQRIAENRRRAIVASGLSTITQRNTGFAGSKVGGRGAIDIWHSGFDAEHVGQHPDEWEKLTGFAELDPKTQEQLKKVPFDQRLAKIAAAKRQQLRPMTSVNA